MTIPANTLRGEAGVRIGTVDFRIAITFSALVKLSEATGVRTLDELYVRLLGFEPKAVACAIRCLIVADDDDKAAALAAKVLDDGNITAADQASWRAAVETAISAHISAGNRKRDERTALQIAEGALLGEPARPS
jgi:hypothetical protein